MITNLVNQKQVLTAEALEHKYDTQKLDASETGYIKTVVKRVSDIFDEGVSKYEDLIKQESTLIEDIDNSGTFSPEMDNPDDPYNDKAQLIDQKLENEKDLQYKHNQLKTLLNQINVPYFGSLSNDGVRRYIGKHTLLDSDFKVLVSDWRSPIGSQYYQYKYSDDSQIKRIYSITSGKLEDIFEVRSGNKEADAYLLKELGNKRGGSLSDIVNTIQSQQDEIIRAKDDVPMIIQGVAGSGKTTILFHRISYLMFNNSEKYNRENVLLLVPTKIFKSYTEDIKIALGIGDIQVMTYSEFIKNFLKLHFPFVIVDEPLSNFDIVEEFKQHEIKIMTSILNEFGAEGSKMLAEFKELSSKNNLLFNEKIEWILDNYELDSIQSEKLLNSCSTISIFLTIVNNPKLKESILEFEKYLKLVKREETTKRGVTKALHKPLVRITSNELNQLAQLKIYLEGNNGYKYSLIAVDEAQNLDPISIKLLSIFSKNENIILAGDLAQKISQNGINNWDELENCFERSTSYFEMNTTYRISKEIVEYLKSRGFKDKYLPEAVISKPGTLEVYESLNIDKFLEMFSKLDEKSDNLAVICNGNDLKERVSKLLAEMGSEDKFGISVFVLDILQSKGLEFDSVITVGFTNPDNFKYIASTRTLNNLVDIGHLEFN